MQKKKKKGIMASICHYSVSTLCFPEHKVRINMLGNEQKPHIGSLASGIRIITFGYLAHSQSTY